MADNVVNFGAFKAKQEKTTGNKSREVVVCVTDYEAYRLVDGLILETLLGEKVIETRQATRAEVAIMNNSLYRELMLRQMAKKYAPHLMFDDHLSYPYIDWAGMIKQLEPDQQSSAEVLHVHPDVALSRVVWPTIQAVREHAEETVPECRIAYVIPEDGYGREVVSNISPLKLKFREASDLKDLSLTVLVSEKADPTVAPMEIELTQFDSAEQRVRFIASLLTQPASEELAEMVFYHRKGPDEPRGPDEGGQV